jgi:hypothetical protein
MRRSPVPRNAKPKNGEEFVTFSNYLIVIAALVANLILVSAGNSMSFFPVAAAPAVPAPAPTAVPIAALLPPPASAPIIAPAAAPPPIPTASRFALDFSVCPHEFVRAGIVLPCTTTDSSLT